ncbi:MAG TPA: glutathione S-transferase family protein [Polyangia bacterium]
MSTPELVLCELADPGLPGFESFSPFCLKTHRALQAARLPYTRRHGSRPDAFRRYNPARQVPVLLVDGQPVADSTEILRRIVELRPGAIAAEPEAWLWEELADGALYGFVVAARWADDRNWPLTRAAYFAGMPSLIRAIVPDRIRKRVLAGLHARDVWRAGAERCWARLETLLDQLDARAPERGWWCGRSLSVADIALFAQLHSLRTPLTASQAASLARRKRLSAWLDRVHEETECAAPIDSSESSSYSAAAS